MKLTREFFTTSLIKQGATVEKRDDLKVEIYRYEARGKLIAAIFGGRRSKPDQHYSYRTEEAREAAIERYLEGATREAEYKAARRATRKNPNTLAIGDILYTSWGYDQTNVDFYQVVDKPSTHFVVIRKVASETVKDDGPSTHVIAVPGSFIGEGKRVKANADNTVKISDGRGSAYQWDGQPKYETGYGYGH